MSLYRSLLLVIASSTQRELARQVRYLKVENEILRSKLPARITITPKERQRLVKFGAKLGKALHRLVTIVTPGKFGESFDAALRKYRVEAVPSPPQAPNTQAFVERFIGSIRRECLDHFVFFGTKHLNGVVRSWLEHYHAERPHQGRENELLVSPIKSRKSAVADEITFSLRDIRCRKRLGGLLKHYERIAV